MKLSLDPIRCAPKPNRQTEHNYNIIANNTKTEYSVPEEEEQEEQGKQIN